MKNLSFPTILLFVAIFTLTSCTKNDDALLKETVYQHESGEIETKAGSRVQVEANAIGWSTLYGPSSPINSKGWHAHWSRYPFGKTARTYRSVKFYSSAHKLKTVNVVYSDGSKEQKTVSKKAHTVQISLKKGQNKKIRKLNAWVN